MVAAHDHALVSGLPTQDSGTQIQPKISKKAFRFNTEDLRFHLESGHFLAQAEIISVLSPTQSNTAKFGPAQRRFSLGFKAHPVIY